MTAFVLMGVAAALAIGITWGRRQKALEVDAFASSEARQRIARGALLYAEYCASCHGAALEGQPNWKEPLPDGSWPAPPHDQTGHTWHHSDGFLFDVVKFGSSKGGARGRASSMPAFQEKLSDDEIRATLAFIQSHWPASIREHQARLPRRRSRP